MTILSKLPTRDSERRWSRSKGEGLRGGRGMRGEAAAAAVVAGVEAEAWGCSTHTKRYFVLEDVVLRCFKAVPPSSSSSTCKLEVPLPFILLAPSLFFIGAFWGNYFGGIWGIL
ncbi:hypothetical protein ABZP36_018965 [Zizania latifolia]